MGARPIVEISDGLNVGWAAFAERPDANNFDSQPRGLAQGFGHARAIIVAIQDGDVRPNKAKRAPVDHEAATRGLHEAGADAAAGATPVGDRK